MRGKTEREGEDWGAPAPLLSARERHARGYVSLHQTGTRVLCLCAALEGSACLPCRPISFTMRLAKTFHIRSLSTHRWDAPRKNWIDSLNRGSRERGVYDLSFATFSISTHYTHQRDRRDDAKRETNALIVLIEKWRAAGYIVQVLAVVPRPVNL